jgi:hypothetical protein
MAAPTTAACVKKILANPEPSTHGPDKKNEFALGEYPMSAKGSHICLDAGLHK